MTNEIKNVPELRFPEFKVEWVEKKLGEITSKISDGIHSTPTYDSNGDIYFINGNNLVNGRIDFKTSKKISVQEFNKYKNYLEAKNTLLLSINGTIGNIAKYEGENILLGKSAAYINVVSKFISRCYIFYYLQTSKIYESFLRELTGTTIKNLSLKSIKNIIVYISELDEQQKIGNFFSKLDRQIELEEQKLEKLEEQKKEYMQQIFSQELRFKDENGNDYPTWKKTTIKEVAKLTVGKSKKNENTGKYIIMDMGTVTKNGTMLTHKSTPHENGLLNKGDLVMPKDDIGGGHIIGKTVFIPESQKYVLGDHVYRLETKKCNGLFLHFYINSDIVNRSLKRKVTGSAQLGLNRKSVEEELVKVPCLEEQEKIGAFFSKLDTFIEKQLSKIELLKERKKGFLQKMFV